MKPCKNDLKKYFLINRSTCFIYSATLSRATLSDKSERFINVDLEKVNICVYETGKSVY